MIERSWEKHKAIGKLFVSIGVSNGLWYNTLKNNEIKTILLSAGWYKRPEFKAKLWAFTILWITLKLGWLNEDVP